MKSIYIICYDISNDKVRRKVEKVISNYGQRVQYSVFECFLTITSKLELISKLKEVFNSKNIDKTKDSIYIYRLCEDCRKKIEEVGVKRIVNEYFVVI